MRNSCADRYLRRNRGNRPRIVSERSFLGRTGVDRFGGRRCGSVREANEGGDRVQGGSRKWPIRQQAERLAALEQRPVEATEFPEQEQQRFAATATAMGLSYGQARELLEIVVKKCPSR
jgi:hypothetical protein